MRRSTRTGASSGCTAQAPDRTSQEYTMFTHNKRLQYTVRVAAPNPATANLLLEQFGGPQGELAAPMRYHTQAISEDDTGRKHMLHDIASYQVSRLHVLASLV